MKKLLILIAFFSITSLCQAQTVVKDMETKPVLAEMDTMQTVYAHVLLTENKKSYLAIMDLGDGIQWAIWNKDVKKLKAFKSPAHLFNFMDSNEWEYVDTIANVSSTGAFGQLMFGVNVTDTKLAYVFKRRKK